MSQKVLLLLQSFLLISLLALAGCGTSTVMEVNKAAVASWISLTDDASRMLAERSALLLRAPAEDYRIGPEDVVEVSIFEWEVRKETRVVEARVGQTGRLSLPILGEIDVEGLTADALKSLLERRLQDDGILQTPRVGVLIKEYNHKKVAVIGAVREPGVYSLKKNSTMLFEALTLAGGTTEESGQELYVIHAEPRRQDGAPTEAQARIVRVDLYELLELGHELNLALETGDVVNVPKAKPFYVVGFVREPGGFPLSKPTTVLEAVALAGGLREREASPKACMLKRQQTPQDIPVDLVAISRGKAPNLYLMPNDVLDVRQTSLKRACLEFLDTFKALFSVGYSLNH